jgi:hypothetical protein
VAGRDAMIVVLKVDPEQESTNMQEDFEIKTFGGTFAAYVEATDAATANTRALNFFRRHLGLK